MRGIPPRGTGTVIEYKGDGLLNGGTFEIKGVGDVIQYEPWG